MNISELLASYADVWKVMLGGALTIMGSLVVNRQQHARALCFGLLAETLPTLRSELQPPSGVVNATAVHALLVHLETRCDCIGRGPRNDALAIIDLEKSRFGRTGFGPGMGENAMPELELLTKMRARTQQLEARLRRRVHPFRRSPGPARRGDRP